MQIQYAIGVLIGLVVGLPTGAMGMWLYERRKETRNQAAMRERFLLLYQVASNIAAVAYSLRYPMENILPRVTEAINCLSAALVQLMRDIMSDLEGSKWPNYKATIREVRKAGTFLDQCPVDDSEPGTHLRLTKENIGELATSLEEAQRQPLGSAGVQAIGWPPDRETDKPV